MSLFKKISALSLLSVFALAVLAIPLAVAQDNNSQNGGGSGLQLSPTRSEISAQPGETKSFKITLKNVTQGEVNAQAFINDFESDNVSGTPQIIVDETKEKTPYSISSMLSPLQDVTLKPGESKEIEYSVTVPGNASPGAYFGALRYAAVPAGQDTSQFDRQVSLTASVAHLVFVEVPGEVTQKIAINSVQAQLNGNSGKFFFKAPNKSAVTVENMGNGFSRPFGKVELTRGSDKAVYSYDLNNTDPKGIVLPRSKRVFTDDLKNVSTPGKYTLTASVAYGNGGEVVSYSTSFWYLPIWFLIVLAAVIILLVVGGIFLYKKYLSGNKSSKKNK